ncbi:MAG: polysaccharide deacetylase family protein [Clostridia bacterium]|nr:polysaccharide deacetylase family protein [Clostridia bacterium]
MFKLILVSLLCLLTSCGVNNTAASESDSVSDIQKEADIAILMYHHFDSNVTSDMIVSAETFDMHMRTLKEAGYTAVTFDELVDYVENGTPLPDNPVCITMDDGYLSNYTIAWPILQKYGMKATIFVVGAAAGWTHYRDTDYSYIPKFTWEQAREMENSGYVDIQSHTYDLHHWPPYEVGDRVIRPNALPLEGETDAEYTNVLIDDIEKYTAVFQKELGKTPFVLAYPNGKYNDLCEEIMHEHGFKVTLTVNSHPNRLVYGDESSLYLLGRYTVNNSVTAEKLLSTVSGE